IGFLTVVLARWLPHPNVRLLVVVGFLGGYTTFSTFSADALTLCERGEVGRALGYLAGSAAAGVVAVGLGVGIARVVVISAPGHAGSVVPKATARTRTRVIVEPRALKSQAPPSPSPSPEAREGRP